MRRGLVNMVRWDELGFQVTGEFSDGLEVLEYLQNDIPDVILTDIDMSRANGVEIAAFVAKQKLPTRVIFLTAYREFSYAKSAVEYQVMHYLLKPISITELKKVFLRLREKLDEENVQADAGQEEASADILQDKTLELIHSPEKGGRAFEKVMCYIREHFNEDITLNEISDNVFLSPVYISRLIKEQTGENYVGLITALRMEKAVDLLKNTDLYVYEIAEQVGYANLKYFYKVFQKVTGKAPNDYRKRQKRK